MDDEQLPGHHRNPRPRAGVYRDYPVSKGCNSPFAPIWIQEMVRRQDAAGA